MFKFLSVLTLVSLGILACKHNAAATDTATPANSLQNSGTTSSGSQFQLIDVSNSKVGISPVTVSLKNFGVMVPSFTIEYRNNNYVQILRCAASFRQELETEFSQVAANNNLSIRQWPWLDAFGNSIFCDVVTTQTTAKEYADLAAPNGNFFYVINPCVSSEFSTTGQNACSFNLTCTDNFQFSGSLSSQFILQAAQLNQAQSQYDGLVLQFLGLVQELMNDQNSCLAEFQNAQAKQNAEEGWADIGTVAGGIVGTAFLASSAHSR